MQDFAIALGVEKFSVGPHLLTLKSGQVPLAGDPVKKT
jgi:hypothetical protein